MGTATAASRFRIQSTTVLLLAFIVIADSTLPDYIQKCRRDDPRLSECIQASVRDLLPRLKVGIPELDIPPIEPFYLNSIKFKNIGDDSIGLAVSNLTARGASSFVIQELRVNLKKRSFRFKVLLPQLHLAGHYQANGRLLGLVFRGEGPMTVNATNYAFEARLKADLVERNGEEYGHFEKLTLRLYPGNTHIRIENLFNGNPTLGEAFNDAINSNLDAFLAEVLPILEDTIAETFTDVANKICSNIAFKELFL